MANGETNTGGRPKSDKTLIRDQAKKLAMGYETKVVHENRTNNNRLENSTVDIVQVPGSVDALRLWKELCDDDK